ncbi:TPA: GGDEF domain-containing protein [Legionella anisa]
MKSLLNKLILFNPQFSEAEQGIRHQFIFLNNVYFFASLVAFIMGFVRWQESAVMGMIDFGFSGISIALLYYLHSHKNKIELLGSIALSLSFLLFFSIYLLAPYNTMRLSLFFLLTASAFFLKGRKKGFLWMALIITSIVLGHFISYFNTAYSLIDIFTTCVYLIALFFIFDNYELIKEEHTEYLEQTNTRLENEVRERTKELKKANKALEIEKQAFKNLSFTDQLTGLYNRYKVRDLFEFEQEQMIRYNTELSVILMDLDFFKSVNDHYGHNAGDAVLKEIALILQLVVRRSDIVARWGGEEFIIVTPKTTLEQSLNLAEKLRQQVQNTSFSNVGHITASFGIASFKKTDTLETMIQRADQALYRAKELGRDNVQSY